MLACLFPARDEWVEIKGDWIDLRAATGLFPAREEWVEIGMARAGIRAVWSLPCAGRVG